MDYVSSLEEYQNFADDKPSTSSASSTLPSLTDGMPFVMNDEASYEKESKLAELIAYELEDRLCFDETSGDWFAQSGGHWSVISEKRSSKLIMEELLKYLPDGFAISKLNNVKNFLQIMLLLNRWESSRKLLPMKNGILNVETMQLIEYSSEFKFCWQLPYAFDPDAKIEIIHQWLKDATDDDQEAISIIRAFFKMALVGGETQKFLELIGPGGTGKSTLLRLLVALIGQENHMATDLKNLESNRFEAAGFYGKRLILISDSARFGGEVSVLKALTGGDPIRYEKKNQQQAGSFVFNGVVALAANEPVQTSDYTSGLIRRRMPVNFTKKISDEDKARWSSKGGIETSMLKELPGLLNWALEMSDQDVKAAIGSINGEMTSSQREHLIVTNKLAAWLDECVISSPGKASYIGKALLSLESGMDKQIAIESKLYPSYYNWCTETGSQPVALQRFTANLIDVCEQLKIEVVKLPRSEKGVRIQGIAIRRDTDFDKVTPVTKKFINAEGGLFNVEGMLKKPLDNVGTAGDVLENLSVTKLPDLEVF